VECKTSLERFFPFVTRRCRPGVGRNLYQRNLSRLKGYRFEISATLRQLNWIDAPHTQNFEILKSLEETQESKKFKITFEIFVKMLDGLNVSKRCLLQCFIWFFFFRIDFFWNYLKKILKLTWKMIKNLSKSVWVEAR
jgi:hypothetical protein